MNIFCCCYFVYSLRCINGIKWQYLCLQTTNRHVEYLYVLFDLFYSNWCLFTNETYRGLYFCKTIYDECVVIKLRLFMWAIIYHVNAYIRGETTNRRMVGLWFRKCWDGEHTCWLKAIPKWRHHHFHVIRKNHFLHSLVWENRNCGRIGHVQLFKYSDHLNML